jgi:hypothetical protein
MIVSGFMSRIAARSAHDQEGEWAAGQPAGDLFMIGIGFVRKMLTKPIPIMK